MKKKNSKKRNSPEFILLNFHAFEGSGKIICIYLLPFAEGAASILVLNFNFLPAKENMSPESMTSLEIWDIIYLHSWPSRCNAGKGVAGLLPSSSSAL